MVRTSSVDTDSKMDSYASNVWDEDRTIQRLGGQRELIQKLVSLFLRDAPKQISQALQGIELHDYDFSHVAVHSLKGTSSNFCTKHLESICAELLEALKNRDWDESLVIHQKLVEEYRKLEGPFKEFLKH